MGFSVSPVSGETAEAHYRIIGVRPDGRPHASPVWGVWLDGTLYFDGSEQTRRMRNIAAKPEIVGHLESRDEAVALEGRAGPVPPPPERALTEKLSALYTEKYADHNYKPQPDQWDRGPLYAMQPDIPERRSIRRDVYALAFPVPPLTQHARAAPSRNCVHDPRATVLYQSAPVRFRKKPRLS